jgi:hypothetical protein
MCGTRTKTFGGKKRLEPGANQRLNADSNPGYLEPGLIVRTRTRKKEFEELDPDSQFHLFVELKPF